MPLERKKTNSLMLCITSCLLLALMGIAAGRDRRATPGDLRSSDYLEQPMRSAPPFGAPTATLAPDSQGPQWVLLLTVTSSFLDFFDNFWVAFLRLGLLEAHGPRLVVHIVAEDSKALRALQARASLAEAPQIVVEAGSDSASFDDKWDKSLDFGTTPYSKLMSLRPRSILRLFDVYNRTRNVLYADIDAVWRGDPFEWLVQPPDALDTLDMLDAWVSLDMRPGPKTQESVCAGFVAFAPTDASVAFVREWERHLRTKSQDDQALFNDLLHGIIPIQRHDLSAGGSGAGHEPLKMVRLPEVRFPSGRVFFGEQPSKTQPHNPNRRPDIEPDPNADKLAIVVHANWVVGADAKRRNLRSRGLWFL